MKFYHQLITILLIFCASGCYEKELPCNEDEVYVANWNLDPDSSASNCEIEIAANELYQSMNFNDTTSANPLIPRYWSSFHYSKIVIHGHHYVEIRLFVSKNSLITWSTMPPVFLCNFRFDPKLKTLKIFHLDSKKFIDFRKREGKAYFEKCLNEFKDSFEDR